MVYRAPRGDAARGGVIGGGEAGDIGLHHAPERGQGSEGEGITSKP